MAVIRVDIAISEDDYLRWYRGDANQVYTVTREGVSVKFPANILQPFITHSGIYGTFEIEFDDHGKFRSIERLA